MCNVCKEPKEVAERVATMIWLIWKNRNQWLWWDCVCGVTELLLSSMYMIFGVFGVCYVVVSTVIVVVGYWPHLLGHFFYVLQEYLHPVKLPVVFSSALLALLVVLSCAY